MTEIAAHLPYTSKLCSKVNILRGQGVPDSLARDGFTGGYGGEHPPTGVQTQVGGAGGEIFYRNV